MTIKNTVAAIAVGVGQRLDKFGREILSSEPVAVPAGLKPPVSMEERIRLAVSQMISQQAARDGLETFEEANDFDVDEEMFDPFTGRPFHDEEVAVNDPNVHDAFQREEPVLREKASRGLSERRKAVSEEKARSERSRSSEDRLDPKESKKIRSADADSVNDGDRE